MMPWGHHVEETPFLVTKDRVGDGIPHIHRGNLFLITNEGRGGVYKIKKPTAKSNRFAAGFPLLELKGRGSNAS